MKASFRGCLLAGLVGLVEFGGTGAAVAQRHVGDVAGPLVEHEFMATCAARTEVVAGQRTLRCDNEPRPCRLLVAGELSPADGLESALVCGDRFVVASTAGDVLADLGDIDPFHRVEVTTFTRGRFGELLVAMSTGDSGDIHLIRWSETRHAFCIVLAIGIGRMVVTTNMHSPQMLDDAGTPASIDACDGTYDWDAASEVYRLTVRRRRALRECREI